jgi:phosphatidate cytidylyltransferase
MLLQRVITALVLLMLFFAAMYVEPRWPFMLIIASFVGLAIWEWLRLTMIRKAGGRGLHPAAGAVALTVGVLLASMGPILPKDDIRSYWLPLWACLSIVWVLGVLPWLLRARADAGPWSPPLSVFAVLVGVGAYTAVMAAYDRGAWFMLSLMALVWFADIAAYFVGRRWGRRKLAPHISPGKTWAGAWGGLAAAVLWLVFTALTPGGYGEVVLGRWGWVGLVLAGLALGTVSIAGDLFESLLKRRAGRKDSSRLLPGHGGVLDRVDALLPVLPLAMLLA